MTHPLTRLLTLALGALISLLLLATSLETQRGLAIHSPATRAQLGPGVLEAAGSGESIAVIVTLRQPSALRSPSIDVPRLRSQVASVQTQLLSDVPASEFVLARRYAAVPAVAGTVTPAGLRVLQARPDVAHVALDGVGDAGMNLTIPLIHADETFDAGVTGVGVIVAVIDTGIDTDHADLSDSIAYEKCFLIGGGCPALPHVAEDNHGHGTNVAGIITSNGTIAPRGVAPDAQIAAYKVLTADGTGSFSDWLAALDDIIANHPEVDFINMSLQSDVGCSPNHGLNTAVTTLRQMGIGTFIASGNHGTKNTFTIPSCLTGAITVGAVYDSVVISSSALKSNAPPTVRCTSAQLATTGADIVPCWSDSSPDLDLLAPGVFVTSTGRTGGTSTYQGTSQASPHAAAVAALMKQAMPGLSLDEIVSRMKSTGTVITDNLADADPSTQRQTPRIDARVALLTDDTADYDGDGCTNGQEYGTD